MARTSTCKKTREKFAIFSNNKLMHPVISLICRRHRAEHGVLKALFIKSLSFDSARSGLGQCVVHCDVAARPHRRCGMTESAKTRYMAVAKYFEGKTLHQIAANLGLSRITIARWLRKW
jgi:hypothetical protein